MKKWILLLGVAIGFVLGSKAGRGPYMQIEDKVREVGARPEVQKAIKTVKKQAKDQASDIASTVQDRAGDIASTVQDRVGDVADRIGDKLPSKAASNGG